MRKLIIILSTVLLMGAVMLLSGCSSASPKRPTPVASHPYLNFTTTKGPCPVSGATNFESLKVGRAQAQGILCLFAWGDASINKAMENGNITKVHHVDYEYNRYSCLMPFYEGYTVIVYGE